MSEVRVKSWPLALIGSLLVHVSALTGVYLAPGIGSGAALGTPGSAFAAEGDTTPLYLMPDELPPDVAARLAAEQAALAKVKPHDSANPLPAEKPEALLAMVPPPPMEPIPVPLGVVDGPKISTDSWLKNDSPLEHGAMLSAVQQPQQDLKATAAPQGMPGLGGADGQSKTAPAADAKPQAERDRPASAVPPTPPTTPADQPAVAAAPAPTAHSAPAVAPNERAQAAEVKPTTEVPEGPSKKEIKAGNSGGEKPKVVQGASEPRVQPVNAASPTPLTKPAAEAATSGSPGGPTDPARTAQDDQRAPGAPGVPSATKTVAADRDSDAASVKRSAVFRNGKVEAGEGLDIRTVRPEFSLTTRALVQPRSPTLEIVFGKDGRAKRVRVLKSSGYPAEVDAPVVTALYNWRAKGRVLDELPTRADSTVALEITIILQ